MQVKEKVNDRLLIVDELPECDICGGANNRPAHYDAKTESGRWGYLCDRCFELYGMGLGIGLGQALEVRDS